LKVDVDADVDVDIDANVDVNVDSILYNSPNYWDF
jgi:hypothetical protein